MSTISSPGIGSGLDIRGLVDGLVAAEGKPVSTRLDRQEAKLQSTLSALGTVKSSLSQFQSAVSGLTNLTTFERRTATSSHPELFTATAFGRAVQMNLDVEVQQLAQSHKLASEGFGSVNDLVGSGKLTFQFGDPSKPARTVTIDANNNTLAGVRDAVNAANIGVRANIINGDEGFQLVFTSQSSGLSNSMRISVEENPPGGSSGLSRLAYDPDHDPLSGLPNMREAAQARDAIAIIEGVQVSRPTNTISDAIPGVTLNLLKAEPGTKASLNLGIDKDGAMEAVEKFVNAYNEMTLQLNKLTAYDPETRQASALTGDATVRAIGSQIRNVLASAVAGLDGGFRALSDLGIRTGRDGTLSLDKNRLSAAMDQDLQAVGRVFARAGVTSHSGVNYLSAGNNVREGTHNITITQTATRGVYADQASSVSSMIVDANNKTFRIRVDGVSSGSISLTEKTYSNGNELAAELQSQINGDENLNRSGVSVVVDFVDGRFTFTSERYGSTSSVEITQVGENGADIGLTANAAANQSGQDVAGTIGGLPATGSGQILRGTGTLDGLSLEILGEQTGNRGSVTFTEGVGVRLSGLLERMLGSNNLIDVRTDSLRKQISGIGQQREVLDNRLTAIEARLMRQFGAMDAMMAQMQTTSNFLAGQLAGLPGAARP